MVELDLVLLHQARTLINAANVHRVKELLFAYEQAVSLHNARWPSHLRYQNESELDLREFVAYTTPSQLAA